VLVLPAGKIRLNAWHYIVFCRDNANVVRIYFDGIYLGQFIDSLPLAAGGRTNLGNAWRKAITNPNTDYLYDWDGSLAGFYFGNKALFTSNDNIEVPSQPIRLPGGIPLHLFKRVA